MINPTLGAIILARDAFRGLDREAKKAAVIMKRTTTLLARIIGMAALCITVQAMAGTPKIHFDQLVYDFGKTSQVATVSGVFKFKNTGDDVLKLEQPKTTCGCTVAELKPNTLQPGESGEVPFTLHLGQVKALFDKQISVKSNDPLTPEVTLSIKADYTPLYDLNPMALSLHLAYGTNDASQVTTLTRTDGNPLRIARLDSSKPWIKATVESVTKTNDTSARIRIAIKRDGPPRRFNEYVHVYAVDQTNSPVANIYISGQILGEVALTPGALYWSITDATKPVSETPEALTTRRVSIRSASGRVIEVKNPTSSIKDLKVELVVKEAGKAFELVARLQSVPASTISGNVSFETSAAEQSRIEVPVIVNVYKP